MMRTRRILAALALAMAATGATVASVVGVGAPPAGAQQGDCTDNAVSGGQDCNYDIELPTPGGGGRPGGGGGGGGGGYDDGIDCRYDQVDPAGWEQYVGPPPSPEAILVFERCFVNGEELVSAGYDLYPFWVVPGQALPPDPAVLAGMLRDRILVQLLPPVPVADPPLGTPAKLDNATFVAVANWDPLVEDADCLTNAGGTVCAQITAEATLTFDPGDGTGVIECAGGGTRYDPNGPEPREQAQAPGACAHLYQRRTGVEGRPDAWPGEVAITWEIAWTQTAGGTEAGLFEPVVEAAPVLRVVEEIQTVNRGEPDG